MSESQQPLVRGKKLTIINDDDDNDDDESIKYIFPIYQVSQLEQELQKQKDSFQQEMNNLEKKLGQACSEVERRVQQVKSMTSTIRYVHTKYYIVTCISGSLCYYLTGNKSDEEIYQYIRAKTIT